MPDRTGEAAEKHRLTLRKGAEVQRILPAPVPVPPAPQCMLITLGRQSRRPATRVSLRYLERNRGSPEPGR